MKTIRKKLSFFDLHSWMVTAAFIFGGTLLMASAWSGSRVALILLALSGLANVILGQLYRMILKGTFETCNETLAHWKTSTDYATQLGIQHAETIVELSDHDFQKALNFQRQFSELWVDQYMAHYPDAVPEDLDEIDHLLKEHRGQD